MRDEGAIELSEMLLNRARETLSFIPKYIEIGDYHTVLNRSYYAAFYAMKSIEILDGYDSKKHSGVISFFRQNYIKTGLLDTALSTIIGRLEQHREISDYNIVESFTKKDAEEQYYSACIFVEAIIQFHKKKII